MRLTMLAAVAGIVGLAEPASALDKVKFGANWLADPEAGGFYEAAADGTYAKYGLDVTIVPGGPQANGGLMLLFGKLTHSAGFAVLLVIAAAPAFGAAPASVSGVVRDSAGEPQIGADARICGSQRDNFTANRTTL